MAGSWSRKRVFIVVRTYPTPARSVIEASCTAAISDDGKWVRMFPVPARLMEYDKRFTKWQWIDVDLLKAPSDTRPESHKLNPDSIAIVEFIGPQDGWRARRQIITPLRRPSMCSIQRERDEHGYPTLGIFRPNKIEQLIIEPAEPNWTEAQLATLTQDTLFEKAPAQTLEKIPFDFRYEFRCSGVGCNGHSMICTDWEMGQAYRSWRKEYGDQWEVKFRQRFEIEMIERTKRSFSWGLCTSTPLVGSSWACFIRRSLP
jgi:hypothetical protein